MSKSLGNFITIHDLLKDWPGDVVRFNMLRTHYRSPIDWTKKSLEESQATLDRWGEISDRIGGSLIKDWLADEEVKEALQDDLNTPLAIARLHELAKEAKSGDIAAGEKWLASAAFLGFDVSRWHARTQCAELVEVTDPDLAVRVRSLVAQRGEARKSKNFKEADRIRDELAASGVVLKDAKDPSTGEIVTTWEVAR
jgi:cysteinyl-tRNA synthetase